MNREAGNPLPRRSANPAELDAGLLRIFDGETAGDKIVPSSGFAAHVMESVRDSAVTPAPLPFPWKRALPAFGSALAILLYAVVRFVGELRRLSPAELSAAPQLPSAITGAAATVGWTAFALLVALVSVKLCLRLAAPKA